MCQFSLQLEEFCHPSLSHSVKLRGCTTCESHDIVYITVGASEALCRVMQTSGQSENFGTGGQDPHNQVMDTPLTPHFLSAGHSPEDLRF